MNDYDRAWRKLRKGTNRGEQAFAELAASHGWRTCRRGWPDFICFKGDEVICVEVKPRLSSGKMKLLRVDQVATLDFLSSMGIRCFVSDGITLEKYDRSIHGDSRRRRR